MNLDWQNALEVIHWIPLDQCKDGWLYHIAARNASLGIYRANEAPRGKPRGISGASQAEFRRSLGQPAFAQLSYGEVRPAIHPRGKPRGILAKANKQHFEIRREKGNEIYRFCGEYHWDWQGGEILFGKKLLGTAKPIEEIEQAPTFNSEQEFIAYMEKRFQELHQPGA